jgi:glycerol-3-phosphate dehydrogenase (NAD(P)+)
MARICILGTGAWGTALATAFVRQGHDVRMWGRNPQTCEEISKTHRNHAYLGEACLAGWVERINRHGRGAGKCGDRAFRCTGANHRRNRRMRSCAIAPGNALWSPAPRVSTGAAADAKRVDRRPAAQIMWWVCFQARVLPPMWCAVCPRRSRLACLIPARAQALAQALSGDAVRIYASDDIVGYRSAARSRTSWPSPSASAGAEEWGPAPKRR